MLIEFAQNKVKVNLKLYTLQYLELQFKIHLIPTDKNAEPLKLCIGIYIYIYNVL